MKVSNEFLKARQMAMYFQRYRELPGVKKTPKLVDDTSDEFEKFKFLMGEYRSLDNSPEDYDPRPGHLLLAEENCIGRALQISYGGDDRESQISQIFVDEPHRGFQENHLIRTEETLHLLVVYPCSDEGWLLEATHWNKSDPDRAQKQKLRMGCKEK